ncbi:MAG TPA: hypothetical protein VMG12_43705 [Polyangiaceae bacterium]|nr:hypothetical protein [Polyangiaceae bacterium]
MNSSRDVTILRSAALLLAFASACSDGDPLPPPTPSAPPASSTTPTLPDTPESESRDPEAPVTPQRDPGASGSGEGVSTDVDVSAPLDEPDGAGAPGGATADAGADAGPVAGEQRPLDLLFVVDNSISMADKQQLLRQVANVLERFAHPACVDAAGNQFPAPAAGAACAAGQRLQFEPVTDVHLGVISTSLGDGGANVACPSDASFPRFVPDRVDNGHLLGALPRGGAAGANAQGFVSWRAGEDEALASERFGNLLAAAGENGCGWEMPLEAWYRFLADPHPYAGLSRVTCPGSESTGLNCVQPASAPDGRLLEDEALLAQRAAFLRPDSRLGIVMLTDENDCSLAIGAQSWVVFAIDDSRPFFRGSSACDTNPSDPCCYSCPLGAPAGCAADPICDADPASGALPNRLPASADGQNLRCFDQKRRFGVDFLYPVARYINALTQTELCSASNDLASEGCGTGLEPNPLFAAGRRPSDVFVAGIVGVPWQLLEATEDVPGRPAVENGFRYKLPSELSDADWSAMLGDPTASPPVAPTSPFMIESALPRAGVAAANPINGREYDTGSDSGGAAPTPDDLQYACIFPLPEPRDCDALDPNTQACDCYAGDRDRPLCEEAPGTSEAGALQRWGKAYPGTRELQLLRGMGEQALVSSICARNTSDPSASDFSYRPALAALVDGMEASLSQP